MWCLHVAVGLRVNVRRRPPVHCFRCNTVQLPITLPAKAVDLLPCSPTMTGNTREAACLNG